MTVPSSSSARTRIFVLTEHELVRRGVRSLLEDDRDLEVVGEAATAAEVRVRVQRVRPDVAVLDVGCRTVTGSSCAASSARRTPGSAAC